MRTYVLTITSTSGTTTTVPGLHATAFRDYLDGVPAFRGRTTADALLSGADSSPVGVHVEVAADGFVGRLALRFEGDSDSLTTDAEAVAWWASLSNSERTDAAEWWPADAERAAALHLEARALQAAADFEAAAAIAAEARAAVEQSDSDRAARIAAEQAEAAAERVTSVPVDGEAQYGQHPAGFYFEVSDLPGSDFGPFESLDAAVASILRGRLLEAQEGAYGRTDREAHLSRHDYLIFEVRDGERFGRMVPSTNDWAPVDALLERAADRAAAVALDVERHQPTAEEEPATHQFHPLEVCSDCLMWAANADDSGAGDDWSPERYSAGLEALGAVDLIAQGEEEGFSHQACPICGALPGDRFSATLEVR